MKQNLLQIAVEEAERFLARVNDLQDAQPDPKVWGYEGSPETAAVRRSSMDLTRALSKLRSRDP